MFAFKTNFLGFSAVILLVSSMAPVAQPYQGYHNQVSTNTQMGTTDRYTALAENMTLNATAARQKLAHYQLRPYFYGKQVADLVSHTKAAIRDYEKSADCYRALAGGNQQLQNC